MLLIFRFTNYLQQFRITIVIFACFCLACLKNVPTLQLYANLRAALCEYSKCYSPIEETLDRCCYCVTLVIQTRSYVKGTSIISEFIIR